MSWVAIGVGVASLVVGQAIRIATAPSQIKVRQDITGDQSDTGVSSGRYGDPIALQYGTGRITCQLIWAKEIREQVNVTTTTETAGGGKGGGGGASTTTTTTTYTYFGTFAVEICSNQIVGISKMWLNSRLFYENRPFLLGSPKAHSTRAQSFFTVYNGGPGQIQDPTIVSAQGAERTPAYRGRAIIVFKDLPLAEFGNRLPVVEVVAVQSGTGTNLGTINPMPVKLHKIVGDLCAQVGLSHTDIDLTQLVDDVDGYQMSQRGNVQGFLRELAQVYQFGCVDNGKLLKFVSHPVPLTRPEYEQNCLINEDHLIVNSYHDILGRSGYFPSSAGTSEGQFAQIIAAIRAYNGTSDVYWLNQAVAMGDALSRLYFQEPPSDPNTLYTPHWLFNVKKNIQLQSSILSHKLTLTKQIDGTYTGRIWWGAGQYGNLITKVTRVYDDVDSYMVWDNPYSGIRGTEYPLPIETEVDATGCDLKFDAGLFGGVAAIRVNVAYVINAGKMLGVSEMMEAWPHWRAIEAGEIDCAVDTLAWALDAFDLLYTATSDTKWQDAYNATVNALVVTYTVDDGRYWFKKAKGGPFVLSGTYLVAEIAPFTESQIVRNTALQLEFRASADVNLSLWKGLTVAGVLVYLETPNSITGPLYDSEIQYGRGITDERKPGDTHIRFRAKSSVGETLCRVFLQDKDDDLVTAKRWYYNVTLTTTMTTYDLPVGSFKRYKYPFTGADYEATGIGSGQTLRVAGIIFYPYKNFTITVETLRPIPEVTLPYVPAVAPYTANSIDGQLLDWAGGPGIGYQNAYVWAQLNDTTRRNLQVQFLVDSQADYTAQYPGTVGPFVPAYVWDRYDVLEIAGTPDTWQWGWPDPNSEWVGYTARCVEGLGRCAYLDNYAPARNVCDAFLIWLNTYWTNTAHYIPTNFPEAITARANSTYYVLNSLVKPATPNGRVYRADVAGTSGGSIPTWPTTIGNTVVDGGVTWRCAGYTYGNSPVYGEYHEPHAAALFLRAAAWYRLSGGTTALADSVVSKCWDYLESLVIPSGPMAGTWSPNPGGSEWWGFWGAEIITTLGLLLTDHDTVRDVNGIAVNDIETRINNYKTWLQSNTRTVSNLLIQDEIVSDNFSVDTIQDVELPNEIIVKYSNLKNSGEGEARYTRKQSGYSDASVNITLNMAMSGYDASLLTKVLLNKFWSERDQYEFDLRSLIIQPMDCLEYDVNGQLKRFIVMSTTLDNDQRLKVSAVSYDQSSYRLSAPAPAEGASSVISLSYPPSTQVLIFNLPAIIDSDNVSGYASGAYSGVRWGGGSLSVSNDNGLTFGSEAVYSALMRKGTCAEILAANRTSVIDYSQVLTIQLEYGELESITQAQLLNRQNMALLGGEIICFQNATLVDILKYEISGFLRGQFGTEDQIYSHGAGESFVMLDGAIQRTAIDQALINVPRVARAFTVGRPSDDYSEFSFTATGASLVPWAPVNITATRATDLVLGWTRRARITNGWNNLIDVPVGETVEQYRVDLLTGPLYPSGTIITSYFTNVPSITITNAQIVAAYGSGGAPVYVAVRQMSSVVGAGKPLEGTF